MYRIERGRAILNKEQNGEDLSIKVIGTFKTDQEAKEACIKHFDKACKLMSNLGKPLPTILFF
jgi:hypothetical protein